MQITKSPAFQVYVDDWRGSRAVQRMTYDQRGRYFEMLVEQWDSGDLPDDPQAVAELFRDDPQGWIDAWPVLRRKFVDRRSKKRPTDGDDLPAEHDARRRIVNLKLESLRKERCAFKKRKQLAGKKGGEARARNHQKTVELQDKHGVAVLESARANPSTLLANPTSSSSSSSVSPSPSSGKDARSGRPMFTGTHLTVHEWMVTDCLNILGPHVDGFNLDAWFFDVDKRAREQGLVIPKRDGGAWLQAQLVAECQRRGLPIRMATTQAPAGKLTTRMAAMLQRVNSEAL